MAALLRPKFHQLWADAPAILPVQSFPSPHFSPGE